MSNRCLVIGGSHAAAQLVISLRQEGWEGEITVISDENYLPYHRPPLSKDFLLGQKVEQDLLIRPETMYEKNNVTFRLEQRVDKINRSEKNVVLQSGEKIDYEKLVICTGSRVRKVNLPGVELKGINYLRTIADINTIKADTGAGKNAVIVGGGYIGLETAAVLKKLGMNVTVLEMAPRILARVTAPEMSEFYSRIHAEEGVVIKTGVVVSGFTGEGHVSAVECSDGSQYPADLVVIGVGILPNVELAQDAGLETSNGINVNEQCATSDPDIYAAGDCAIQYNALYEQNLRLESVPNASEQARVAAAAICGKQKSPNPLPWFWSDQYDLKLQIAGLSQGFDEVKIRGNTAEGRSFVAFYFKQSKLIAADCINRPVEFMNCKKIIKDDLKVDVGRLVDESIPPKEWF